MTFLEFLNTMDRIPKGVNLIGYVPMTPIYAWVMGYEEARFKLSYFNAVAGEIRDRGFLREGTPADVVVYDLDKLALGRVETVHDLPGNDWLRIQRSELYRLFLVNGQVTLEDGNPTGALPGKLLRHGVA